MLRLLTVLLVACCLMQSAFAFETKGNGDATAGKIQWQSWSDRIFEQAKSEHKLVILDLEAVWCHWCHVMDERTYSNPAVAKLINSKYIAVRVDQDSRPDLSNKYQDFGWPATIFFASDGTELAKRAGFIDPDDMVGLLQKLANNPTPEETAKVGAIKYAEQSSLGDKLRKELLARHVKGYDTANGAWSFGQKFLDAESVELAMLLGRQGDAGETTMARQSLDAQLNLLDPAWGGVYQYSTHNDWRHPHFEKIMNVQSDNMRMYALGYEQFGDPKYLAAARSIARYLNQFLKSPEGAFYTSQDADLVPGKHSDTYFKLSDAQRRKQGVPRVDKHIYARENGWAISGLVALYQATGEKAYLDQAIKAADWIVAHRSTGGGGFSHDAHDAAGPYLADSLYMGQALMALYTATGDRQWLSKAQNAADFIAAHFQQPSNDPGLATAEVRAQAIAKPEPLLDENVAAARFFALLSAYSGKPEYKKLAESTVRYLATPEIANKRRIFVGGILLADREVNSDPIHITVVGKKADAQALVLFQAAQKYPVSYKMIEWFDRSEGALPSDSPEYPEFDKAVAFGCAFERCSLPIFDPAAIAATVDSFAKK